MLWTVPCRPWAGIRTEDGALEFWHPHRTCRGPTRAERSSSFCSRAPRGWQVKEERLLAAQTWSCKSRGVLGARFGGERSRAPEDGQLQYTPGTLVLGPPPEAWCQEPQHPRPHPQSFGLLQKKWQEKLEVAGGVRSVLCLLFQRLCILARLH